MSLLGETLGSFRKGDGSPDYKTRKLQLGSFIQYLTHSEVRDLRLKLNAMKVTDENDPIKLPLEIVQNIAQHLDLEETIRARRVSTSWRITFQSRDMVLYTLRCHFPLIWERYYKRLTKKEQNAPDNSSEVTPEPLDPGISPGVLLQTLAKKHIMRKRGFYHFKAEYKYPPRADELKYCNGRVAFANCLLPGRPGRQFSRVTVSSLRSKSTSEYMDENREHFHRYWLFDSLLVCEMRGPLRLLVWGLDLPASTSPITIHLPSGFASVKAQGDCIAIVTSSYSSRMFNFQVMTWKWGQSLRGLNTEGLQRALTADFHLHDVELFFHPYDTGRLYILSQALQSGPLDNDRRLWISEYILQSNEWVQEPTWLMDYQYACSRGTYLPAGTIQYEAGNIGIHDFDRVPQCLSRSGMISTRAIINDGNPPEYLYSFPAFNMFTKTAEVQTYRIPASLQKGVFHQINMCDVLFWKDQLLVPVWKDGTADTPILGDEGLMALDGSPSTVARRWDISRRGRGNEDGMNDNDLLWSGGKIPCWGGGEFKKDKRNQSEFEDGYNPITVQGDDDFVVLSSKAGYVVWCFDERVPKQKAID